MKYFFLSLLIITFSVFVFSPFSAKADDFCKSGIVPCGRNCDNPDTSADETKPCTLCHLIVGFYDLIQYGLKIVVFVALVCLVIAGVVYIFSAGNEQIITTAKTFIKQVLYGVGFVLAAWLLIFVVMNYFGVKSDLGIGSGKNWYSFTCSTESVIGTGKYMPDAQGNSNIKCEKNGFSGKCKKIANCPDQNRILGTVDSVCKTGEACCGSNGDGPYGPECGTNSKGMCSPCYGGVCWITSCSAIGRIEIKGEPGCGTGYICCGLE